MYLNTNYRINFDFLIDNISLSFSFLTLSIAIFVYIYTFSSQAFPNKLVQWNYSSHLSSSFCCDRDHPHDTEWRKNVSLKKDFVIIDSNNS